MKSSPGRGDGGVVDCSVVIVNWNGGELLRRALRSLRSAIGRARFRYEVIVVDNGSTDGSAEVVRREFPEARLIEVGRNLGFARAANIGMKAARGRYFLLMNNDIEVPGPEALDGLLEVMEAVPDAALAGCRQFKPDGRPSNFPYSVSRARIFASIRNLLPKLTATKFRSFSPCPGLGRGDVLEVGMVGGAFLAVRREAVEEVGMLDEDFFFYGEDTDWCLRFGKAGWRLLFVNSAHVVHLGAATAKRVPLRTAVSKAVAKFLLFRKHGDRRLLPLALLLAVLGYPFMVGLGPIVRGLSKEGVREGLSTLWRGLVSIIRAARRRKGLAAGLVP